MFHLLDSLDAAAHAAAQALLNGLWQGILLTLGVALVLHFLRGVTAAMRHAAWFATLLVVVALPLAAASLSSRAAPMTGESALQERTVLAAGEARAGIASPAPSEGAVARFASPVWRLAVPPGSWLLLLLGTGLLVGVARTGRLIQGLRALRRLKRASHALPRDHQAELEPLCAAHARRRVSLRVSDRIATPITVGFLHPAVLVPGALLEKLSREELAQIVLHELAHIRRGDDWTNLTQRLVEAVLFFHPAVWWIGRRLDLERELACDDYVVASLGGERAYARCLTRLAELALASRSERLAPGAAPRASQLTQRVRALLAPERPRGIRVSRWNAAALVALLAAGGAALAHVAPALTLVRAVRADVEVVLAPSPVQGNRAATDPPGAAVQVGDSRTIALVSRGSAGPRDAGGSIPLARPTPSYPAHGAEAEPVPEVTPRLAGSISPEVVTSVQAAPRVAARREVTTPRRDRRRGVRLELFVGRSSGSLVESTTRGLPDPAALGLPGRPAAGGIRLGVRGASPPAPYPATLGRW